MPTKLRFFSQKSDGLPYVIITNLTSTALSTLNSVNLKTVFENQYPGLWIDWQLNPEKYEIRTTIEYLSNNVQTPVSLIGDGTTGAGSYSTQFCCSTYTLKASYASTTDLFLYAQFFAKNDGSTYFNFREGTTWRTNITINRIYLYKRF